MPPPHLTNFQIQKYFQKEPAFNAVYSRNNLPKIKNRAYAINIDEYKSIENYWVALYLNSDNVTYFDTFRTEHIPIEIKNSIGNTNIKISIYRIQENDYINV